MEELEELIEDADRDGSGSVDFQVMIFFIVLYISCFCIVVGSFKYLVLDIDFFIFRS